MIMVISPNKRYMEQLARTKALEPEAQSELEPEAQSEPGPEPVATAAAPDPDEG